MTQKWNLQDIRPAEPRKRRVPPQITTSRRIDRPGINNGDDNFNSTAKESFSPRADIPTDREHIPSIIIENGNKKEKKRLLLASILFFVIIGGALGLSAFMGKTELIVHPIYREPTLSAEFIAYPDKREKTLSYEIMTVETVGESQVKASGQVTVKEQAKGVIEILKSTPGTERLIKNTRFRTPEGLVYKIQESVVVPGAIKNAEGVMVPGMIQAEVFAADVGDEYNIPAGKTFDVPGFQESNLTELYKSITARNSQPFTGGFDGPQFQIDETELNTARQALQIKLRDDLLERIKTEKPAEFIAFPQSVAITYNQLPATEYGNDLVTIKEQAVLQIPLFNIRELGTFLAQEAVSIYDGGIVRLENYENLNFSYKSATTSSSIIANETSLTFILTGKPLLIWEYDDEKLKSDLAGLSKTALLNVTKSYPGIYEAKARITPFWKRAFPEEAEDIIIIEELKPAE